MGMDGGLGGGGVGIINGRSRPSELRNYRARRADGMLHAFISDE